MTIPTYDFPQSPILITGFFGILFTLVLLYIVNRDYFNSPLNRDKKMTLIDFDKKELLDIYRALQYTRFEECPVPHSEEGRELYHRLTNLMEKVSKTRSMCTCKENVSE